VAGGIQLPETPSGTGLHTAHQLPGKIPKSVTYVPF